MSGVPSSKTWMESDTSRAVLVAALYGVSDPQAVAGMEHIGWTWEFSDGSWGFVKRDASTRSRSQPTAMRPVYVAVLP